MIRPERPDDFDVIRELNRAAFNGDDEARLVDRLRSDGLVVASLVAEHAGELIGHICFSELPIRTANGSIAAVSLAPMAVRPGRQRTGVGSRLVRAGLEACRATHAAVLVLGHADYYPRFGFSAELARRIASPFSGPSWMVLELKPGALAGIEGSVQYPAAFGILEH